MTPLIKSLVNLTPECVDYTWFDNGVSAGTESISCRLIDTNLPYKKTAICGEVQQHGKYLILAEQITGVGIDDLEILICSWVLMKNSYKSLPIFAVSAGNDEIDFFIKCVDDEKVTDQLAKPIVAILAQFLRRLEFSGFIPTPQRNSFINKKRAKAGKAPIIFDWHTVRIERKPKSESNAGGTHASPRKHQRRGHWRTLGEDKKVWVKDCWVGDATKGMVFKDYDCRGKDAIEA